MVALQEAEQLSRDMGIDILGRMPWGTHVCLFYKTKEDLTEVLVPYFKAGLQNNEYCVWLTCEPLIAREAERAMRRAVPGFGRYLEKGQIEILAHDDSYLEEGRFEGLRVLAMWRDKLDQALANGYAGMRIAGNAAWLDEQTWEDFAKYERALNETIGRHRMLAVCAYWLDKCGASEIIDVVNNHQLGLVKQDGKWTLTKNAERKQAEERLLEYQAQLKSLASELLLTEERERHRIATELYDRVGQSLAASKIKLETLRQSVAGEKLCEAMDEICSLLSKAIADAGSLAFDLSSPVLYELGFETAVAEWLSEQIEKRHGIKTEFRDDGQVKPLDDRVRVLLFRDVRELLINVVKHAQATKVRVSIGRVSSQICVTVEDDGIGFHFDPAEVASQAVERSEFGLFGIRARLAHLGGHLEIESARGCGCKATIMAPLGR
jgi:signal transduction histidine kinase